MKRNRLPWAAALLLPLLASACGAALPFPGPAPSTGASAARQVALTILQLNDIYELTPVSGGKEGGLARVATLRKELLAENPNTPDRPGRRSLQPFRPGDCKGRRRASAGKADRRAIAGDRWTHPLPVIGPT